MSSGIMLLDRNGVMPCVILDSRPSWFTVVVVSFSPPSVRASRDVEKGSRHDFCTQFGVVYEL